MPLRQRSEGSPVHNPTKTSSLEQDGMRTIEITPGDCHSTRERALDYHLFLAGVTRMLHY